MICYCQDMTEGHLSDFSVSSVHTSDLSEFADDDDDATTVHSSSVRGDDVDMDISATSSTSDDEKTADDDASPVKKAAEKVSEDGKLVMSIGFCIHASRI